MKTLTMNRILMMVILFALSGALAFAQEAPSEEEQKKAQMEEEMKAAMEAEMRAKKEMLEQERQQMKQEQQRILEQEKKMRELERQYADQHRDMERQAREAYRARESSRARASSRSSGIYTEGAYVAPMMAHQNQSQLTLRNSFRGGTDTSKGEFEVEPGTKHFKCVISGKVNSGEIYIAVEYPDGKAFKELTINSAAEISFSQSLTIKEEEEKRYFGAWKYVVKAEKAEGSYMLQIMTN
jgi:hypothetical protein